MVQEDRNPKSFLFRVCPGCFVRQQDENKKDARDKNEMKQDADQLIATPNPEPPFMNHFVTPLRCLLKHRMVRSDSRHRSCHFSIVFSNLIGPGAVRFVTDNNWSRGVYVNKGPTNSRPLAPLSWEDAMWITLEEFKELTRIQENVRRNANALELCSRCQRISECQRFVWDHGASVLLCNECRKKKEELLLLPTPQTELNLRSRLDWSGLEWWKEIGCYWQDFGNFIRRLRPVKGLFAIVSNRAFRRDVRKYSYTKEICEGDR